MITCSPYEDVPIPDASLPDFVLARADNWPERPALIDGVTGRIITYQEFASLVRKAAAGLSARGFGRGDVLALVCPNVPEYAITFHAALWLGGTVTPANPLLTLDELLYQLRDSGASLIVTAPPAVETCIAAMPQSAVREVFVVGESVLGTPFGVLLDSPADVPLAPVEPSDTAVLPYSSGTTGLPKGVRLTHHNLVANLAQLEAVEPVTPADVLLGILPFYHIYGMTFVLNLGLRCGAAVVTMPRFDLGGFHELVRQYSVTRAPVVPPIVRALATHPAVDVAALTSLRVLISGAAPLAPSTADACAERLGCIVKQGYGLTEASPVTHINPDHDVQRGSVGVLLPNTECQVIDVQTGEPLPPGQRGEVLIRGPQVMAGYLNPPDTGAEMLGEDGWLHTGDVGIVDDRGNLTLVDRIKELIKYKGYQVAPAELEALLTAHPAVAAVAVIPSPDDDAGEVPKACIVRAEGSDVTAGELMDYVAARVAPHKRVRRVEFVGEIPVSASGKILRRVLIERERADVSS